MSYHILCPHVHNLLCAIDAPLPINTSNAVPVAPASPSPTHLGRVSKLDKVVPHGIFVCVGLEELHLLLVLGHPPLHPHSTEPGEVEGTKVLDPLNDIPRGDVTRVLDLEALWGRGVCSDERGSV